MFEGRRKFINKMSLGAAGLALGTQFPKHEAQAVTRKSRVSFIAGKDRREMIYQAVKPFEKEIKKDIQGKQVIIKPNNVWHDRPLCATHPDAVRGLLDFLIPLYDKTIIIGESTASPKGTMFTFEQYGYSPLEKEFNIKLVDLNREFSSTEWILGNNGNPLNVEIIDTFLNPNNYIISLARMKTHNCVVATLALKNVVMAAPLNVHEDHPDFIRNQYEKAKMHEGGIQGINYNMFTIARKIRPQFSIIDGFIGMEGNGPSQGTPVEHGVALAGPDVVAVDRIGIELMGIDYSDIGYLQWCSNAGLGLGDRSKIEVTGPDITNHIIKYRLHENIEWQLGWKNDPEPKK